MYNLHLLVKPRTNTCIYMYPQTMYRYRYFLRFGYQSLENSKKSPKFNQTLWVYILLIFHLCLNHLHLPCYDFYTILIFGLYIKDDFEKQTPITWITVNERLLWLPITYIICHFGRTQPVENPYKRP